jgi:flagella basal body P-ring formation protein FlgA
MNFVGSTARKRLASALLALCAPHGAALAAAQWQPTAAIETAARSEAAAFARVAPAATALAPGYELASLRLPRCASELTARGNPTPGQRGRISVEVQCADPSWRLLVPVAVEESRRVVVLARALPAGSTLGPGDLALADRDARVLPVDVFAQPGELVGARLLRNAGSGQVVASGWVRRPPAVRRGQPVTIVASSAAVVVRAEGIAIADAQIAERVRVRNRSSGRELQTIVRGVDLVEVALDR